LDVRPEKNSGSILSSMWRYESAAAWGLVHHDVVELLSVKAREVLTPR
jgi:hypothetical protein